MPKSDKNFPTLDERHNRFVKKYMEQEREKRAELIRRGIRRHPLAESKLQENKVQQDTPPLQ